MLIYASGRIGLRSIELARCTFGSLTRRRGVPYQVACGWQGRQAKPPDVAQRCVHAHRGVASCPRACPPPSYPAGGHDVPKHRLPTDRPRALPRVWSPAAAHHDPPHRPTGQRMACRHRVEGSHMSPYLLRHTAATPAFEHGATLTAIKAMLRHANLSMTVAYLARLVDEPSAASTWSPGVAPERGADRERRWGQNAVPAEILVQGTVGALLRESRPVHGPSDS